MNRSKGTAILTVALVAAIALAGCNVWPRNAGPTKTEQKTIKAAGAQSVSMDVKMGAGRLAMSGGAAELMDATFTYNVDSWKPEVSYSLSGNTGTLTVQQPSGISVSVPIPGIRYEWDIALGNNIPIDLTVDLGAGESTLDLRDAQITSLDLSTGASSVHLSAPARTLAYLDIQSGVGSLVLDLTGDWAHTLQANIKGGVGSAELILPRRTGVRVKVTGGLGTVNASGFSQQGGAYVNDTYGTTQYSLDIEMQGGVGEITLQLQ